MKCRQLQRMCRNYLNFHYKDFEVWELYMFRVPGVDAQSQKIPWIEVDRVMVTTSSNLNLSVVTLTGR